MQASLNSTSFFFEWVPVLSALLPILGLPWAAIKIFTYFKPHLIAVYSPNWLGSEKNSLEWNVEIVNRTRKNRDISITFVPLCDTSVVKVIWFDPSIHPFFDIENSTINGKGLLKVNFWPVGKNLFVNLHLNNTDYPLPFCDEFEIQTQFLNVKYQKTLFFYPFFSSARIRVVWIAIGFAIITLICLTRIFLLSFS